MGPETEDMRKLSICKVFMGVIPICMAAQAQKLELATIKPHAAARPCPDNQVLPGGTVVVGCYTFDLIVREAWNLLPVQLSGGPDWVRHDQWDITAKAESVNGASDEVLYQALLKALAMKRFHLKLRSEKRPVNGFALVVARKGKLGPALTANHGAPYSFDLKPGPSLVAQKVTMQELADRLRLPTGMVRKVEDKTGLKGEYEFTLKWTPLHTEQLTDKSTVADVPTIFTALREQMGLKLLSSKVWDDFYVIESAQRPDAN